MKNLILFAMAVFIVVSCDNEKSVNSNEKNSQNTIENFFVKNDADTIKLADTLQKDAVFSPVSKIQSFDPLSDNLKSLYKTLEKKSQNFNVLSNSDTLITCSEGTVIRIPEQAFVEEETGIFVTGKISFQVKEYYKISDILLSNLSTTSDGKLLETGGMLYIEVICNNKKCKIAPGKSIEIRFPYKKKSPDMELFTGVQSGKTINWMRNITSKIITKQTVYTTVDHMPEFYGGEKVMENYIIKKIIYPVAAKEKNIQGTVYVQFIVSESGSLKDVKVIKSPNELLSEEAIRIVKNMPEWKPGKKAEKIVPVQMVIPIRFMLGGESGMQYYEITQTNRRDTVSGQKYFVISDTTINNYGKTRDIAAYVLYSTNLGWINCDRFRNNFQATDYVVEDMYQDNLDIKMVFHKYKSILYGQKGATGYTFKQIPLNEKITIVAIKYEKNKNYIAVQETVIGKEKLTNLEYEPASVAYLKEVIKKLDHLN